MVRNILGIFKSKERKKAQKKIFQMNFFECICKYTVGKEIVSLTGAKLNRYMRELTLTDQKSLRYTGEL